MTTLWVTLEAPSLCQSEHLPRISLHIWFLSQMPLEVKKREKKRGKKRRKRKKGNKKVISQKEETLNKVQQHANNTNLFASMMPCFLSKSSETNTHFPISLSSADKYMVPSEKRH